MPQERSTSLLAARTRSALRRTESESRSQVEGVNPLTTVQETIPRRRLQENAEPNDDTTVGVAAMIEALQEQLVTMRELENEQQAQISRLHSTSADNPQTAQIPTMQVSSAKIPQIESYSGKREDQTSTRVKAFVYNIRKVRQIGTMNEESMLPLADCYLQERAATWMMRLEAAGNKPTTLLDLQQAMINEFVPSDGKAQARTKLMRLRLTKNVDAFISTFRELIEICETPLLEAYLFFFSGLLDGYKCG